MSADIDAEFTVILPPDEPLAPDDPCAQILMEGKLWTWAVATGNVEKLDDDAVQSLAACVLQEIRQALGRRKPVRQLGPAAEPRPVSDDDGVPF